MNSRHEKDKKTETYNSSVDMFIERLKKVRALNCSPSDVGIDNFYTLKKMPFNKLNVLMKIL